MKELSLCLISVEVCRQQLIRCRATHHEFRFLHPFWIDEQFIEDVPFICAFTGHRPTLSQATLQLGTTFCFHGLPRSSFLAAQHQLCLANVALMLWRNVYIPRRLLWILRENFSYKSNDLEFIRWKIFLWIIYFSNGYHIYLLNRLPTECAHKLWLEWILFLNKRIYIVYHCSYQYHSSIYIYNKPIYNNINLTHKRQLQFWTDALWQWRVHF